MRIDGRELGLFLVLRQTRYPEPPRIFVRIFAGIIPSPLEWAREMRPYLRHGLDYGIHGVQVVQGNPRRRFNAKYPNDASPSRDAHMGRQLRLDDLVDELFFRLPASPKRRGPDD